jgi:hypothetical protein
MSFEVSCLSGLTVLGPVHINSPIIYDDLGLLFDLLFILWIEIKEEE